MAIDREYLGEQVQQAKDSMGSGIRWIKKDITRLRIMEFLDEKGRTIFSRVLHQWNRTDAGGNNRAVSILNRAEMFKVSDAVERLNELEIEEGREVPYESRKKYLVSALDMDNQDDGLQVWAVPYTVWTAIADLCLSDEWANVLEPDEGHALIVKRTGKGLQTKYTVQPDRRPWPVPDDLQKQVTDPIEAVMDPGLRAQAEAAGSELADLYGQDIPQDAEPIPFTPSQKPNKLTTSRKKARSTSRKPKPESEPEDNGDQKQAVDDVVEDLGEMF